MTDLITELHALAQRMAAAGETDEPVTVSLAAEEIERLQKTVELRAKDFHMLCQDLQKIEALLGCESNGMMGVTPIYEAVQRLRAELERLTDTNKQFGKIIHNQVVANQAAWIEWQHGKGAEAAMAWVHNGLWGPGQIPDESEPWANDPQAYYNANKADPFPVCPCGRPSNQLWMGNGACCHEHMKEIQKKEPAKEVQS